MALQNSQSGSWLNQDLPSPRIDAAICDLLARLQNFSDSHIDISYIQLTELELEELTVRLIARLTYELQGQCLAELVSEIRDCEESL